MTEDNKIPKLISKQLIFGLDTQEEEELNKWLNKSKNNIDLYSDIIDKYKISSNLETFKKINHERSWDFLNDKIIAKKKKNIFISFAKYAAAITLILLTTIILVKKNGKQTIPTLTKVNTIMPGKAKLYLANGEQITLSDRIDSNIIKNKNISICKNSTTIRYNSSKDKIKTYPKLVYNKIEVLRGGEYNFYLSDGTHVFLNSESKIEFPVDFTNNKRKVKISGEVFFDVVKNKQKPFIVHSNLVDVVVTGTQFNVKAYPDEGKIQTTLVEGGVDIYYGDNKKDKISIKPNQQAEILRNRKSISIKNVDTDLYVSWIKGQFIFEGKSLEEIMTILTRWYDINVFYQNEDIKNIKFSGKFYRYNSIDQILKMISITDKVEINKNKKTIILKEK